MEKKPAEVIETPHASSIFMDEAISIHMNNLFHTYGEVQVKAALSDLFNLSQKDTNEKVA